MLRAFILRVLLKFLMAVCTLGAGWLLGIYLLDWSVPWRVSVFLMACWGIGHFVYFVLRKIDKRFGKGLIDVTAAAPDAEQGENNR